MYESKYNNIKFSKNSDIYLHEKSEIIDCT